MMGFLIQYFNPYLNCAIEIWIEILCKEPVLSVGICKRPHVGNQHAQLRYGLKYYVRNPIISFFLSFLLFFLSNCIDV